MAANISPYRSPIEKMRVISRQGCARTAIVTVLEGASKGLGRLTNMPSIGFLGGAFRNWGRMESLYFLPRSLDQWAEGEDWKYHRLYSLSSGLYGSIDLANWTLRHAQVNTKGTPIEGALQLFEQIAALGILVGSAFGIADCIEELNKPPVFAEGNLDAFKTEVKLDIAIKSCAIAEVALKLVAQQFKWYKTADLCVRVTSAVFYLMCLWNSPKSLGAAGGVSRGGGPGGDDDNSKKPSPSAPVPPARPPQAPDSTSGAQGAQGGSEGRPTVPSALGDSFAQVNDAGGADDQTGGN